MVITARPSYSRVKSALKAIQQHPELELQLVVTGTALLSRFGSAIDYIEEDGFEISERVYMVMEGESPAAMAKTTGIGILELSTAFTNLKPDMVISIADRYETMSTAIAASYMNIPLVHIQGGEVTGNIDEKVRHAITKLSDIHLVTSEDARQRLLNLGEEDNRIFVTGCPSIDLAGEVKENPSLTFNPIEKYGGVGALVDSDQDYLVVLQHPLTTEYEQALQQINETLNAINDLGIPTFWFWPNVDAGSDGTSKGIRVFRENQNPKHIHFFKNMEGKDFLRLIYNSKCLVGNSSVGIRESSYLGIPVVNIGQRQNKRLRGKNVLDVACNYEEILSAINSQISHGKYPAENLYGDSNAGKIIAETLASLKEVSINKTITY